MLTMDKVRARIFAPGAGLAKNGLWRRLFPLFDLFLPLHVVSIGFSRGFLFVSGNKIAKVLFFFFFLFSV